MGSQLRLKTYLVQPAVPYKLVKFQDRCFPGGREKLGVPKIFDPQQSRPPLGDTPESRKIHWQPSWEHSQEISSKSTEPFPRNSTIHFGYFTPSDGWNHRPHIRLSPITKKNRCRPDKFFVMYMPWNAQKRTYSVVVIFRLDLSLSSEIEEIDEFARSAIFPSSQNFSRLIYHRPFIAIDAPGHFVQVLRESWRHLPKSPNGGAAKWANRQICHFLNGSPTLTTNISRTNCCRAAIFGRIIVSNQFLDNKLKHLCLLASCRHQGAPKVTQMPIFQKFQKIVEKKPLEWPPNFFRPIDSTHQYLSSGKK